VVDAEAVKAGKTWKKKLGEVKGYRTSTRKKGVGKLQVPVIDAKSGA
jgi:hypothetical protein